MTESRRLWKVRKAVHSKPYDITRLLLQAVAFVCTLFAPSDYWPGQFFWLSSTLVAIGIVIAMLALALFLRERYVIEYTLNPETGTLYDAKAGFANVSLRVDTLNMIFARVLRMQSELDPGGPEQLLYEAGCNVGHDFAHELREYLKGKGKSPRDVKDPYRLLKRVLKYDSSSGMGRFTLASYGTYPTIDLRIDVLNTFTGHTLGACEFLKGYITGICKEVFNKAALTVQELCCVSRKTASDGICRFHVTESEATPKPGAR